MNNIENVRKEKEDLEKTILDLFRRFETEYGVAIVGVDLLCCSELGRLNTRIGNVKLTVEV